MTKKIHSKHRHKKTGINSRFLSVTYVKYLPYITLTIIAFFLAKYIINAANTVHVLGVSTGPVLLADDATDNQAQTQQPPSEAPNTGTMKVDCVLPNGQHITTTFKDCQDKNQQSGREQIHFTPLGQNQPLPSLSPQSHLNPENPNGQIEIQAKGNHGEINVASPGTQLQIKRDNGELQISAHQGNEEMQINNNAIDVINETLKDKNIEVGTTSANNLSIRKGGVEAQTDLPLSIDPTTKSLSVTTSHGNVDLNVLPDQAVATLLNKNILTNVLSSASSTGSATANPVIALTQLNNQPAFAVQGVTDKKLFGLFPTAFTKTVYVSATDGSILKIQESFINQILESFSF